MYTRTCSSLRMLIPALLLVALAISATACGDAEETTTTAASAPATTQAADTTTTSGLDGDAALISANWEAFFSPATPAADKAALLENGAAHAADLQALAANPAVAGVVVKVTAVTVNTDGTADVIFDVISSGQTMLTGETGTAVLQDGMWKVSEQSLAGMLSSMGGGTGSSPNQ